MNAHEPVLEIRGLSVEMTRDDGPPVRITEGVDLALYAGRTLALVGESGCGKSVTGLAALNLLAPPLRIAAGQILLRGGEAARDIAALDPASAEMRRLRGRRVAMIFQDPMTALDPVQQVGAQIAEPLRQHLGLSRRAAAEAAVDLLRLVDIPDAAKRARDYPFQLSGGMRQRVMIAIAVACSPGVLIADEPTTALDVTVQAQILDLLRDLGERLGMATLLITHDLGVVAESADDVAVMYCGAVVERATAQALFAAPSHPYTRGLLASLPQPDDARGALRPIQGQVPGLGEELPGCRFAPRCGQAMPVCRDRAPGPIDIGAGHEVACWLHAGASGP